MSRVPLSVDKRRALSLKMKKIQSDPQRREHLSKVMTALQSSPERRANLSRVMSEIRNRPEHKERVSKQAKERWADHNHTSGKVRGLLCSSCNTAIGLFKEDIQVISNAINYLNIHKGV